MNLGKKILSPGSRGGKAMARCVHRHCFQSLLLKRSYSHFQLFCGLSFLSHCQSAGLCEQLTPPPRPSSYHGPMSRYTVSQGPGGSRPEWRLLAGGAEKTSNGDPVSMAPIPRLPTAPHTRSCVWEVARKPQWAFHPPNTFLGLF